MDKKSPQRMCISCKSMKDKKELLRIVKSEDGISLDFTGKKNGRGAYICNHDECLNKCVKAKQLNRTFKCEVDKSVYERLTEDFRNGKR